MSTSTKARAEWMARYRSAGAIYAQDPCGCVVFILVDMPEEVSYAAKDIARQISAGRDIKRAKTRADIPPHYCPEHEPVLAV